MRKKENRPLNWLQLFTIISFAAMFVSSIVTTAATFALIHLGVIRVEEEFRPDINWLITIIAVINIPIGILVAMAFSRIPMKPIRDLVASMNRLAKGDFKTRITPGAVMKYNAAYVEVVGSFNKMAQELENTELLRSDFINNFSHEFKTPIVSIAGFARILNREGLSTQQQKEYLAIIEEESLRLSYMATNVLNLTKVENLEILTEVSRFNLSEQLRSCILLLEKKWERKALELRLNFDEHSINANEELLKEVWINLLDNAIKFSPAGQIIEIDIREAADIIAVSILNTGSEIPVEQQQKIFGKFYQADESHSAEGNGIGLAVVKKIVSLHKGTVQVSSEDSTTCFTVILPK